MLEKTNATAGADRFGRVWRTGRILMLAAAGMLGLAAGDAAGAGREKKVFAHHMGSLNAGRGAMTWHMRNPELGDAQHSNGGDYRTYPLVPYDHQEMTLDESADFQIRQAMRIGIDGFAVNAWAGGEEAKQFLDALFRVAEANDYPFEISICPDPNTVDQPNGLTRAWADAIRYLLDRHGNSPKLARRDGKPIIFGYQSVFVWVEFLEKRFNNDRELVDIARTTPEGWALVGEAYRGLEQLVGQPLYFQFDMGAFYHGLETRYPPENGVARAAEVIARQMPALCEFLPSKETRGIAEATVMAGAEWGQPIFLNYDNPRTPTTFGGPGTDTLRKLWSEAREFDSTLLQLSTWNDYHEHTNIAPGMVTNYAYFDLTGYFIDWWKSGSQPEPDHDRVYLFSRKYPRWANMYPFQDQESSDGVIEVLTILPRPARIKLPGRGEYDAPAGLFHQHFPVTAGDVKVELIRDGNIELVVKSPEPVTDRPFRQDNGIVGISSEFARHWAADFGDRPFQLYSEYGDIDGDGLPNWFEMYWFGHFGDMSTATAADPHADVNGDGYTNLEAYLLQRSPIAPPGTQPDPPQREPFAGGPIKVPGRIEAEYFDKGGPGVAYFDRTDGNEGGEFRPNEQVGIEVTSDEGGGYNVGWIEDGEWLKYTIDVHAAGIYDLHVRVARQDAGSGKLRFFFDGKAIVDPVAIPSTGGWQQWETVTVSGVRLKEGVQTMQLAAATGWFNINYVDIVPRKLDYAPLVAIASPVDNAVFDAGEAVEITAEIVDADGAITRVEYFAGDKKIGEAREAPYRVSASGLDAGVHLLTVRATDRSGRIGTSDPVRIEVREGRRPFSGEPIPLPGRVRASHFDLGGPGVAYFDTTEANEGHAFRPDEGVDLQATSDIGGGYNVGWTVAGEWLLYTVDVQHAGNYDLAVRVATIADGSRLRIEFDGAEPVRIDIPNTGGWQNWTTVTVPAVALSGGEQTMRIYCETGDFNVNYVEAASVSAALPRTYAGWLDANFAPEEIADKTITGETADPNGDGVPNLLAYALGLKPAESSREKMPKAGFMESGGERYLTLTYARPRDIDDVIYVPEVSSDLKTWLSGGDHIALVSVTPHKDSEVVVVRDKQPWKALTARQFRLRVERVSGALSE